MWDFGTTRQKLRSPGRWIAFGAGPTYRSRFNWRMPAAKLRQRYRGKVGWQIAPDGANGWRTFAPSAIPYQDSDYPPVALDRDGLTRVREAFVATARRAARLGIHAVQLHGAHGYLLHQFLYPLSNRRNNEEGCGREYRMGLPLDSFDAVV